MDHVIGSAVELLLDGSEVHGILDDVKVILVTQCHGVDSGCKDPAVFVSLQTPEDITVLAL